MAEIALGGIQIAVHPTRKGVCTHSETLSTISDGVERVVCEACGNLSILEGPVARESFARPADALAANQRLAGIEPLVTESPTARYGFGTPDETEAGFVAHRPQRTLSVRPHSWNCILRTLRDRLGQAPCSSLPE